MQRKFFLTDDGNFLKLRPVVRHGLESKSKFKTYNLLKRVELSIPCGTCGQPLYQEIRLHTYGKKKSKLLIEGLCLKCGVRREPRLKTILNNQIVGLGEKVKELGLG